jgi:hypothetical protein
MFVQLNKLTIRVVDILLCLIGHLHHPFGLHKCATATATGRFELRIKKFKTICKYAETSFDEMNV